MTYLERSISELSNDRLYFSECPIGPEIALLSYLLLLDLIRFLVVFAVFVIFAVFAK